ncbi:hypothetical protein AMJ71_02950 [candidate division TA06 bacterium SM1_40]|uniref:Cyclic nucleotide-binding domain-containing protein n=2 Tax=Bacteria division TA06 TaxID=1156500 RepID=A0A0S8JL49_UNCT6|nr:MAG: hypothetical protein AMJ82_03010 [candidate division TA06 bacterium SM23_40]KPL10487.1 MAG: hypothetical protein AMJ71_02950 [candidate division TA06 bacterium SM1_40]
MPRGFRKNFATGLIAILPLALTVLVLWFFISKVGDIFGRAIRQIPQLEQLPNFVNALLGLIAMIILIYLIGLVTSSFLGRQLLRFGELLITRLPLIRSVYTSARQLTETLFVDKAAFRKVVLVEFPRKGMLGIGFVTSDRKWKINDDPPRYAQNVFLPTCPNPTSGWYLLIPEEEIISTSMTVEWGMKIVISGGMVLPYETDLDKWRITES